jgi:hypothetical protein
LRRASAIDASHAIFPSARMTRLRRRSRHSSSIHAAQFATSSGNGLFAGGAHLAVALM